MANIYKLFLKFWLCSHLSKHIEYDVFWSVCSSITIGPPKPSKMESIPTIANGFNHGYCQKFFILNFCEHPCYAAGSFLFTEWIQESTDAI